MIVVIGNIHLHDRRLASGPAVDVARAAAAESAEVQIFGRVGDDPAGDTALFELARAGIGHMAVLRDATHPTPETPVPGDEHADDDDEAAAEAIVDAEADRPAPSGLGALDAADVELGLSYLPEYRVIVVAEPLSEAALAAVVAAGSWSGAALVVVGREDELTAIPDGATVFAPPDHGSSAVFATMVGTYVAALDRGDEPQRAFAVAAAAVDSDVAG